ncbi:HNH endonuclease [Pelagibius sp.]|uniref:HNH endonuclease n=1 Tax=Pelagibius sp. TaxID=1931238 RepID=UPI00261451D7|nr:HNH endonuclease [Pelagibius sp.]
MKDDGAGRVYEEYQDALDDLADQIGLFCSYCEMPIKNAPEVEHVQPKSLEPDLALEWSNFLLGCKSCNSTKGNTPVNLKVIAFPDTDNTFRGLSYNRDRIEVSNSLGEDQAALMGRIVRLVKLHRHPHELQPRDRPTRRDRRYKFRGEAWILAEEMKQTYVDSGHDSTIGKLITDKLALEKGFFSIWMTVFSDHPEMLNGFIKSFPGTAQNCFDAEGAARPRPGGRI